MNASPHTDVVRDFEACWGRSADIELPLPAEVIRLNQYLFIELSPLPRATWDGQIQNAQIPFHGVELWYLQGYGWDLVLVLPIYLEFLQQ